MSMDNALKNVNKHTFMKAGIYYFKLPTGYENAVISLIFNE